VMYQASNPGKMVREIQCSSRMAACQKFHGKSIDPLRSIEHSADA
jgi:hypothetical protein